MSKSVTTENQELSPLKARSWTPYPYMRQSVKFLLEHAAAGLLADPGLGKTSITLAAIKVLKQEGVFNRALVIPPLRPMYSVWPKERDKWTDFHGLSMEILHGPNKFLAFNREADIYLLNPDGLPWFLRIDGFKKLKADLLVVDESTKFKNTSTQRFKFLKPYIPTFKRRWILTGSPMPNGYLDLFGQMYILDLGNALSPYVTHYRAKYFNPDFWGYNWTLKQGADKLIQNRISPLTLRLDGEKLLDLPEIVEVPIYVDLPTQARKIYDQLENEMITIVEDTEVTAVNAAAASIKCSQVANGGLFHMQDHENPTLGGRTWTDIHTAKVEAVQDLIDELSGKSLLIAYDFEHDLARLRNALPQDTPYIGGGINAKRSEEIMQDWNANKIPILLGQPQSVAHGLNLQEGACHHVCFHSLTWNYENYDQFIRRIRRQGNTAKKVFVHLIIAKDTVDEAKLEAIRAKKKGQDSFLAALKGYVNKRKQRQ